MLCMSHVIFIVHSVSTLLLLLPLRKQSERAAGTHAGLCSWVHVLLALAVQGGSAGPINHGALFSGDLPKVQPPCRERGFPLSGLVGEKCRNIFPPYRQWPFAQQAGVPNC